MNHNFGFVNTFFLIFENFVITFINSSEFIIGFADENELELIDIYDITSGHPEWYEPDKVHPNKHGAKAIAASVFHWIADDI